MRYPLKLQAQMGSDGTPAFVFFILVPPLVLRHIVPYTNGDKEQVLAGVVLAMDIRG